MLPNRCAKLKYWRKTHIKKHQKTSKLFSPFGDSKDSSAKVNSNTYATFCEHIVESLKLDEKLFLTFCNHVKSILGNSCLTLTNVCIIIDSLNSDQRDVYNYKVNVIDKFSNLSGVASSVFKCLTLNKPYSNFTKFAFDDSGVLNTKCQLYICADAEGSPEQITRKLVFCFI